MELLTNEEIFFKEWEPKLTNRFFLYIDDIPSFIIKAAGRPKLDNGAVVLDHINIDRKLKGKSRWQDFSITLYDPIEPSGAEAVIQWIRLGHESVTGRDGYANQYKKDIKFHTLGPPGDKVEEWDVRGAYIVNTDFGEMNWSEDTAVEINCTIAYDYAVLT